MSFDWKQAVGTVAPLLGTALGGPFGGIAAKVITDALDLPQGSEDSEISAVLQADPDALVKFKEAEQTFKAKMKELDIKEKDLEQKDRADARNREIQTKDPTNKRIATLVIVVWLTLNVFLFTSGVPEGLPEAVLYRVLGTMDAALMAILYYYFGSSDSSAKKNEIIGRQNGG